jgi:hypothetical protein
MYTTFRELALLSPSFIIIKLTDFVFVKFGVIVAVTMEIAVIAYITPCSVVGVDCVFVFMLVSKENCEH